MKKVIGFLILCCFLTITSCKTIQKTTIEAAKTIPYFTFYTLDNQRFTQDSFDNKRTKLIMYFNSECEHCQKQGEWLSKELDAFNNVEMTFISYEEMDAIKNYRDTHNFNRKNITFIQDSRLTFSDKFGVGSYPSILIYTKKGKLVTKFEGETKVSIIIESLPKQTML